MGVSVPAMRRFALLVMWIAACGDNASLHIVVEQPTSQEVRDLISRTVVTVYESELASVSCEHIELDDVSADLLRGAAVAEQTITASGVDGALDNISRLGTKYVVARLYSDAGALVAAGCTEAGDLSGDVTVTVTTEVAATVALDALDLPGQDDPYGKRVTIVDPLGQSLADREVRWRVFAPAGGEPATPTNITRDPDTATVWDSTEPGCTDNRGIVELHPVPPARVAGFSTRFRVAWPATPIGLISGFVVPGFGLKTLTAPPAANRCAIRTVGERRLVCLEDTTTITPRAHRYEMVQLPSKNYFPTDRGTVDAGTNPVGVVAVPEAGGQEVYAITQAGGWQKLFGATAVTPSTCTNCTIDDFKVLPACGNKPAKLVMHSTTGAELRITDIRGGDAKDFALSGDLTATATINSTGCVTTLDAQGNENVVQVIVLDFTKLGGGVLTRGVFECGAMRVCSVPLPFPTAGVGFVDVKAGTKVEHQMVGTAFDIAGAELIGWIMRPTGDGNTFLLIARQHITAAAPPANIVVGKLDADDDLDLAWNIRGNRTSLVQVSYAQTIETGARLSALAQIGGDVQELLLGDLTGDGFDDLVGVGALTFVVVPTNIVGPTTPIVTDEATCAP